MGKNGPSPTNVHGARIDGLRLAAHEPVFRKPPATTGCFHCRSSTRRDVCRPHPVSVCATLIRSVKTAMHPATLRNNTEDKRYELVDHGEVVAFADYTVKGNEISLTHTEVDAEREGKGNGSALARLALDDVKNRGMQVVPACQFIAHFIRNNPQYRDLIASQARDKP